MNKPCIVSSFQRMLMLALLAVFGMTGCRPGIHDLDAEELSHPAAARAAAKQRAGDIEGAIAEYNRILIEHPEMARIHLDLAFLYDSPAGDYVRAIYHYQRYLELRPQTEKQAFIEEHIEAARESLVGQYGLGREYLTQKIDILETEKERIKAEKMALRQQGDKDRARIEALEEQLARASGVGALPSAAATSSEPPTRPRIPVTPEQPVAQPPPEPPPAPAIPSDDSVTTAPRNVNYVIQSGDNLSALAQRFYGDRNQWRRIYDANRERIPNPNILPVGVTIVISDVPPPRSGNRL